MLFLALGCAAGSVGSGVLNAAIPYDSAKLSYVQNQVTIGALSGGGERAAKVSDVVRASDFVQTESDSRAELTFEDSSIVRVGQNAVFTFEAASRTLSLKKGTMMFFVPPGSGGGTIKTPSLTAAIAGTVGKVSSGEGYELIALLSGELKTKWGNVPAGWAIEWRNGKVRIFRYDPSEVEKGKLFLLGGRPLPEHPTVEGFQQFGKGKFELPNLHYLDLKDIQVDQNVEEDSQNEPPPADRPKKNQTPRPTPSNPNGPTPTPYF